MADKRPFIALNIAVLTISDSRRLEEDVSGQVLQDALTAAGHQCHDRTLVRDDKYAIREVVSRWINAPEINAILTTGGTGITGRDGTPEAIRPLLDKEIEGFGEAFRQLSYTEIGSSSLQSRALAGVANSTYTFVLPGSSGACRTAWSSLISHQLDNRTLPCNLVMLMPRLDET
ncbi:MAG TPA: molybdenum cofactor biosynthesis protein B [Gammaproteobacteria bacterium]|nr:molybdenum cofactor biosynthesis protein B [Gammaproteobacteria bacterium]